MNKQSIRALFLKFPQGVYESEEPGGVMEAEDLQVLPSRLGGLGLMARRSFRKGEVVLVERPFLTVGELLQRSRNSRTA